MSELGHAYGFRDLIVYQKARAVAKDVFEASKRFPKEETYSLTDQVRRSVRSIGAQVTEAWAKRRYERHFISKLTDSDGEQQETQHWIETAGDCGYLSKPEVARLVSQLSEVGRMLNSMIQKADSFCGERPSAARESAASYFIGSQPPTDD